MYSVKTKDQRRLPMKSIMYCYISLLYFTFHTYTSLKVKLRYNDSTIHPEIYIYIYINVGLEYKQKCKLGYAARIKL